jgi:hypothetical protein
MFILGVFVPRCSAYAAVPAAIVALGTAIGIAYAREFFGIQELSFTWVLPGALAAALAVGLIGSLIGRPPREQTAGLTWWTRRQVPLIDHRLFADWAIADAEKRHTS